MALSGCKLHTMARFLGVDDKTLLAHFSELIEQNRAAGKVMLYKKQFAAAMEGDNTMLIWLGKNRLDQTDKARVDTTASIKLYDVASPVDEV